jgi:pimeloyl-ACP methyl ester carboxylesterase
VGDDLNRIGLLRAGTPIGVVPHLRRLARKVATTGGIRGVWRELRGLGTHLALYPLGLVGAPVKARENGAAGNVFETPVVQIHGYFHNRSGFFFMSRELRAEGFRWIHGMNYNPLRSGVPELAAWFKKHVDDVMQVSGSDRVHLIGHSLGGVVARWYIQELGGENHVDHCVTVGTPHTGTVAAYIGIGPAAKDMRPGSEVMRHLEYGFHRSKVAYVNFYSDFDVLIVPAASAVLPERSNVHNCLIQDLGHTSLLVSDELIKQVCAHLIAAEVTESAHNVRHLRKRA